VVGGGTVNQGGTYIQATSGKLLGKGREYRVATSEGGTKR